jgi:hypothetical protein
MPSELFEKIQDLRFERMRNGQASCEFVDVPSIPGMRVAIVPLLEREYDECLELAAAISAGENPAGWLRRDRRTNAETLARCVRNPNNLEERVFEDSDEVREVFEVSDINFITDMYFEMVARSSPALDQFSPQELEDAKKVLQTIDWNELSGRSWYALNRFLSSLGPTVPLGKFHGSSSTNSLTTTSDEPEPTPDVSQN